MCGILCYVGPRKALPLLLEGLHRLEYRGYDSCGVAQHEPGGISCLRAVGKIVELEKVLADSDWQGSCGLAHTRWATHGAPTLANAHPHGDCHGKIYVIHNGIIENYRQLKGHLLERGHRFLSETDSEVLAHLIEEQEADSLLESVMAALRWVEGTFGLGVLSAREPGRIVVARRSSPVILGMGQGEVFAASDAAALVNHTRQVIYLKDGDVALLDQEGYTVRNLESGLIARSPQLLDWDVEVAEKAGFAHFMLKEIHEQPQAIANAMRGRLIEREGLAKLGGLEPVWEQLREMRRLAIVSCGTSFYAGLVGRYLIESCTDISVDVDLSSEFRYRGPKLGEGTVVLAISQSGETADTLAALREARRKGVLALGLVNVVGSSIAQETDAGVYNHAGPEIGVASTKSFVSQVAVLYVLALGLARCGRMTLSQGQRFIRELRALPEKVQWILDRSERIAEVARRYAGYSNFLYLGRQLNYPIAMEGALKLKEISYLHAEAYAAGEMKHGPIALIGPDFPSVCLASGDGTYAKMLGNIEEIRARQGPVLAVGREGDERLKAISDDLIEVPAAGELFSPLLNVVPLQLLAYYIALERGCEIDQPRNLAKSVTVE